MRRPFAALLVSLLVFPHALVVAQGATTTVRVVPGTRVRVTHPVEGTRVGTALAITDELLFVRWSNDTDTVGVPLAEVTRLDVSNRAHKNRALKHAGIGLVAGAALGAIAGSASYDKSNSFIGEGALAAGGAMVLGGLGGVIGLISGLLSSEPWQEVLLDRPSVGIVAPSGGHGAKLGFALAF